MVFFAIKVYNLNSIKKFQNTLTNKTNSFLSYPKVSKKSHKGMSKPIKRKKPNLLLIIEIIIINR